MDINSQHGFPSSLYTSSGPLSGITVIDLTSHIAGPYCTKLLAEAGANVIKIERPNSGDPARAVAPFFNHDPHPDKSALFLHLNTGKKSITLDLKRDFGQKIVSELVKTADIVIESFKPGTMDRLNLGYDLLESINPELIVTSISNFGQSGPYRNYKASEIVLGGLSGSMIQEGERHRPPLKFPGNQSQYFGGAHAAAVSIGALFGMQMTGVGQHIDISIFEAITHIPQLEIGRFGYSGDQPEDLIPRRPYYQHHTSPPSGIHPCKDGYVVFFSGHMYLPRVCQMIDKPELAINPLFSTPIEMDLNGDLFLVYLLDWLSTRKVHDVVEVAQEHRIPVAPLNLIEEIFDDPQITARGYWANLSHPVTGQQLYPGVPIIMPSSPFSLANSAPLIGQHNGFVYSGILGFSSQELALLKQEGVI